LVAGRVAASAAVRDRVGVSAEYLNNLLTRVTASSGLPGGQIALTWAPSASKAAARRMPSGHQVVEAIAILDCTAKHIRHGFWNSISEILTKSSICKGFTGQD